MITVVHADQGEDEREPHQASDRILVHSLAEGEEEGPSNDSAPHRSGPPPAELAQPPAICVDIVEEPSKISPEKRHDGIIKLQIEVMSDGL